MLALDWAARSRLGDDLATATGLAHVVPLALVAAAVLIAAFGLRRPRVAGSVGDAGTAQPPVPAARSKGRSARSRST